ncbi:hypothetical protein CFIMG_006710RA [Ceratocystis fimbriata CBS 114723]|uniref:Uncharacterized protein n=1 Tax=Ceratocystis fimbriata CBS 114723 TaxID=1035309 RepID=A0A2C5WHX6_9PEZI|nr:hypothetical protein CFIMG_006710RA [Ceratocystis fimbriata CBS 114723]
MSFSKDSAGVSSDDNQYLAFIEKSMRANSLSSQSTLGSHSCSYHDTFPSKVSNTTKPSPGNNKSSKNITSYTTTKNKNKNVYTSCGRHTDQFLFSGPPLSSLVKALFGRQ